MIIFLSGVSSPFILLFLVAFGAYFTSFIIEADAAEVKMTPQRNIRSQPNPTGYSRNIKVKSATPKKSLEIDDTSLAADIVKGYYPRGFKNINAKRKKDAFTGILDEKLAVVNHYICPPITVEMLRKRYGSRRSVWGEWSIGQTRRFYTQQLPFSLQIDGSLGLSLVQRAQLAAEARHALRLYSRERCYLPGRIAAELYDGIRHLHTYGYWSSDGMSWREILLKYRKEAEYDLGSSASDEALSQYVYQRILDKACTTNSFFDQLAKSEGDPKRAKQSTREKVLNIKGGSVRSESDSFMFSSMFRKLLGKDSESDRESICTNPIRISSSQGTMFSHLRSAMLSFSVCIPSQSLVLSPSITESLLNLLPTQL